MLSKVKYTVGVVSLAFLLVACPSKKHEEEQTGEMQAPVEEVAPAEAAPAPAEAPAEAPAPAPETAPTE